MMHLHVVTPPSFLVETKATSNTTSPIWSGWLATSSSHSAYNFVEGQWNEVNIGTSCSGGTESTWAGLGGWGVSSLAQAGTAYGTALSNHEAWYEILPDNASMIPIGGVFGHPGYRFTTTVQWTGVGSYKFYVYDSYSGHSSSFSVGSSSYDGSTADFVIERTQITGGGPTPLSNYFYLNYLDAWVNGTGSSHGVGNSGYSPLGVDMWNGNDQLAVAQQTTNSGQTFQDNYYHCN
jgi:hypothetical protein